MVACPRCGADIIGPPGARRVCASCGRTVTIPTISTPAPPTPRAAGPGSFSAPMTPPGAGMFAPAQPAYSGPRTNSVPALLSLIFGIAPWLVSVPLVLSDGDWFEGSDMGSTIAMLGIPLGIAAIVLGIIGIKQVNREPQRYKGKGMAIAGLTLGIVFTALWIIALIVVLIFCLAYIAAYGKSTAVMAPCPAVALQHAQRTGPVARRTQLRLLLAHHPECGAFRNDVLSIAGLRLCASCAAFVASATIASYLLFLVMPSAAIAPLLIVGASLLIVLPQSLSALRWTTTRVLKMFVKSTMGLGAAILFAALVSVPWEGWTRFVVLNLVSLVAILLILPRKQRLYDEMLAHRHDEGCGSGQTTA